MMLSRRFGQDEDLIHPRQLDDLQNLLPAAFEADPETRQGYPLH